TDLASNRSLELARDLFLFSFYTRGMSFVDMSYLTTHNLNDGILSYRRKKTGQLLFIKWEKCMQDIVDKYRVDCYGEYLLPIITNPLYDSRKQYLNSLSYTNKKLKKIACQIGLHTTLTMYVARHSWASIAKQNKIPISIISEGMGHDSESTTQIYLASLDTSAVDRANNIILNLI
ncbi:MAG: integrase catalytic domain-containing protein, partial [Bacteroidales bacterium]|nr:integrase catalytic domain-containing protein [Bacteroidales bacterium]